MPENPLIGLLTDAITANDPPDLWNVISNYDENHWDDIAAEVAPKIANTSSDGEVSMR